MHQAVAGRPARLRPAQARVPGAIHGRGRARVSNVEAAKASRPAAAITTGTTTRLPSSTVEKKRCPSASQRAHRLVWATRSADSAGQLRQGGSPRRSHMRWCRTAPPTAAAAGRS